MFYLLGLYEVYNKNIILTYYFKEIKTEKRVNHLYASRNKRGKKYLFTFSVLIFENKERSATYTQCPQFNVQFQTSGP